MKKQRDEVSQVWKERLRSDLDETGQLQLLSEAT